MPPADHSIRAFLRGATADEHSALDRLIRPLFLEGEPGYVRFLQAAAAAVVPLEKAAIAARVEKVLPDWAVRSRTAALMLDLAEFGMTVPSAGQTIAIDDEAFLFGILYVLEGSRLGARSLVAELAAHPSAKARKANHYLSHGAGRRLWPSFLRCLETSNAVQRAPNRTVAGAKTAFAVFAEAQSRAGQPFPCGSIDA
jgi:heme oxygenase (biliverdin-IX-beta and delta-forming)